LNQFAVRNNLFVLLDFLFLNMSQCGRPDCHKAANSSCSGCRREQYCGSDCQNLDWKKHKSMCPILKKLSNNLQPYGEILEVFDEILTYAYYDKKGNKVRILEHFLLYLDNQFRDVIPGVGDREERAGMVISNWDVDISIKHKLINEIIIIYNSNQSISDIARDALTLPYFERSICLLSSWLVPFDLESSNRIDSISINQVDFLLKYLSIAERGLALITMERNQVSLSEGHCQRCLTYSRRMVVETEEKTSSVFLALRTYVNLRSRSGNYSGAVLFAEEGYNHVVEAYDPVHPLVQEAASWLIDCLIKKGDLFNAERYAEQTYNNLRDSKNGMDQNSAVVGRGAYYLADVINRQHGNLIKAEGLARESLRICQLINSNDCNTGDSYLLLGKILRQRKKYDDDTKEQFQRALAIFIRHEGSDGVNTSVVNIDIGQYYYELANTQSVVSTKRTQLLLAKSHLEEAIRIERKVNSLSHPNNITATTLLSAVLIELSIV
jgi:tetratricopeptide (TPR) repeat protein